MYVSDDATGVRKKDDIWYLLYVETHNIQQTYLPLRFDQAFHTFLTSPQPWTIPCSC